MKYANYKVKRKELISVLSCIKSECVLHFSRRARYRNALDTANLVLALHQERDAVLLNTYLLLPNEPNEYNSAVNKNLEEVAVLDELPAKLTDNG